MEQAFGHPGIAPRWTSSSKEGVGTAYNTASRVWFTLSHGILNEVYFPTVDSPQVRDLGCLVTDGQGVFHEEKRDLETRLEYLDDHALGYRLINSDREKRYRIVKEVIADPHLPCIFPAGPWCRGSPVTTSAFSRRTRTIPFHRRTPTHGQ